MDFRSARDAQRVSIFCERVVPLRERGRHVGEGGPNVRPFIAKRSREPFDQVTKRGDERHLGVAHCLGGDADVLQKTLTGRVLTPARIRRLARQIEVAQFIIALAGRKSREEDQPRDHQRRDVRAFHIVLFVSFVAIRAFVSFVAQKSICRLSLTKRGGMMPVGMRHPESEASRYVALSVSTVLALNAL